MVGDASVEAPVDASRGVRINGVENYFVRQSARPLLRMLGRVAAADSGAPLIPPGQMGLGAWSLVFIRRAALVAWILISFRREMPSE